MRVAGRFDSIPKTHWLTHGLVAAGQLAQRPLLNVERANDGRAVAFVGLGVHPAAAAALAKRLEAGEPEPGDLAVLREELGRVPTLWQVAGNMATNTQRHLINDAAGKNLFLRESLEHGCEMIKRGLGYDESPMLEKLLIEAVTLASLRWGLVEYRYTVKLNESVTLATGDYWERKLNAAQRRYLRALTTLARVRQMDLPPMQINIGGPQVNIAGR